MKRLHCVLALPALLCLAVAGYGVIPAHHAANGGSGGGTSTPKASPDPFTGFDAFVEKARLDWKVPGLAIAVVKDGKVILAKGYGSRDVASNLPVTPDTRFGIGSASKSFTVAVLGTLVGEGKLDWDKPVREYIPEFRLFDDYASDHITARDMVTHRSGLPGHDAAWYNGDFSRAEMVRRMRYLEPSKGLGESFQYNNMMLLAAGHLGERVSNTTWEDSVRKKIFNPLGMSNSDFLIPGRDRGPDFSKPYQEDDEGKVQEIAFPDLTLIGPAGSIYSSANDMAKYVQMYLAKGKWNGEQVLPEAAVAQMESPQMITGLPLLFPEVGHTDYGMGFRITPYRGHKLVHHAGAVDGFTGFVTFMPQDNLGVVVFTNLTTSYLPYAIAYNIYDRLLGVAPADWSGRMHERARLAQAARLGSAKKERASQKAGTHPSHPLDAYAGEYQNPGYGVIKIQRSGDDLTLAFHGTTWPLRHFHYDVFEIPDRLIDEREASLVGSQFMFHTNWEGEIDSVSSQLEPKVKDIVFTRVDGTHPSAR